MTVNPKRISKKIVLLGDPGVGKTSMIRRFVYDIFDDRYITTLGMKVTKKMIRINNFRKTTNLDLTLMIWDLMGQKEYQFLHKSTYKGTDGAIIVCDITRRNTLDNVPEWVSNLFNITGNIPVVLICNKCDLSTNAEFSFEELQNLGRICKAKSYLTSAKNGNNVEIVFNELGMKILNEMEPDIFN